MLNIISYLGSSLWNVLVCPHEVEPWCGQVMQIWRSYIDAHHCYVCTYMFLNSSRVQTSTDLPLKTQSETALLNHRYTTLVVYLWGYVNELILCKVNKFTPSKFNNFISYLLSTVNWEPLFMQDAGCRYISSIWSHTGGEGGGGTQDQLLLGIAIITTLW